LEEAGEWGWPHKAKKDSKQRSRFHGKMELPTAEAISSLLPVVGNGMTP